MNEATQEQIEMILDDINFNKIQKGMESVGWEWSSLERTPTASELRKVAKGLLYKLSKQDENINELSMGGFRAKRSGGIYKLEFVFDKSSPLSHLIKGNG